jgi:hypothetical protein
MQLMLHTYTYSLLLYTYSCISYYLHTQPSLIQLYVPWSDPRDNHDGALGAPACLSVLSSGQYIMSWSETGSYLV